MIGIWCQPSRSRDRARDLPPLSRTQQRALAEGRARSRGLRIFTSMSAMSISTGISVLSQVARRVRPIGLSFSRARQGVQFTASSVASKEPSLSHPSAGNYKADMEPKEVGFISLVRWASPVFDSSVDSKKADTIGPSIIGFRCDCLVSGADGHSTDQNVIFARRYYGFDYLLRIGTAEISRAESPGESLVTRKLEETSGSNNFNYICWACTRILADNLGRFFGQIFVNRLDFDFGDQEKRAVY